MQGALGVRGYVLHCSDLDLGGSGFGLQALHPKP